MKRNLIGGDLMNNLYMSLPVFLFTWLLLTISTSAETFETKTGIDSHHNWTIKFNDDINKDTVNNQNIYVVDSEYNFVATNVYLHEDNKRLVKIEAPTEGYKDGATYKIYILTRVKSIKNVPIKEMVMMDFKIKEDSEIVHIPDKILEESIRTGIYKYDGEITVNDMQKLVSLNTYSDFSINDLTGLEYAENLKRISISQSNITDISQLESLTNLQSIDITANGISDITPLKNLTSLEYISISGNNNLIPDIDALNDLVKLESLYLSGDKNRIYDISPLKNLTNLKVLYIRGNNNKISDISHLTSLKGLERLYLFGKENNIINVSALGSLINLEVLELDGNKIDSIMSLGNLTNLKELSLAGNQISDISSLGNLIHLEQLSLADNKITDISALIELKNLRRLSIARNPFSDISVLLNLPQLSSVGLGEAIYYPKFEYVIGNLERKGISVHK